MSPPSILHDAPAESSHLLVRDNIKAMQLEPNSYTRAFLANIKHHQSAAVELANRNEFSPDKQYESIGNKYPRVVLEVLFSEPI
jgi:hypothetical protein